MQYMADIIANNAPLMVLWAYSFWKLDRRLLRLEDKLKIHE